MKEPIRYAGDISYFDAFDIPDPLIVYPKVSPRPTGVQRNPPAKPKGKQNAK